MKMKLTGELSTTPNERYELIIIKTPYSMTSSRFHTICELQFSHKQQVCIEYLESEIMYSNI